MLRLPHMYKQYDQICLDNVYKAMHSEDLSECVVTALKLLNDTNNFVPLENKEKSTNAAIQHGAEGKRAFCRGDYSDALDKYNLALLRAPQDSEVMMMAYFNRAELLFEKRQFVSCLKDIDTCLSVKCRTISPDSNMVKKLQDMKACASKLTWIEKYAREENQTPFTNNFFEMKGDRHPDIPCASAAVKVDLEEPQQPKVVAARDIPVGTVLALEPSFISASNLINCLNSCYHCHKLTLNLMPCEGCCAVSFCDKDCREQAMREGHKIECKIINIFMIEDTSCRLPTKAVLKMRQSCHSWDEFISASHDFGVNRVRSSSIAEIFGPDKFSLLNCHYERHFIYGAMFNTCMYFANVIHYLDTNTSFLPSSPEEKNAAIRAMSRIMMHLALYSVPVAIHYCTYVAAGYKTNKHQHQNNGYFPFIGKLRRACLANCYVMGMRNSAALVTTMPIKKGSALTISFKDYWLDTEDEGSEMRALKIYFLCNTICSCVICRGDDILNKQVLNDIQKKAFLQFIMDKTVKNFPKDIQTIYRKACTTLQLLSEVPYTTEYSEVYNVFAMCLIFCMNCQYPNVILADW